MLYRQLGRSGARVSVVGLGTNQFGGKVDAREVDAIIGRAVELGVNFIDTSNSYQKGRSEETLGLALQGMRDRVLLATKVYFPVGEGPNDWGLSRHHMLNSVEDSLRRLRTDHIDLYQMHRWDNDTPLEETLRTLDDLISAGKVRYVGASAFAAWQLAKANLLAEIRGWEPFVTIQSHYHMLERGVENELLPYCKEHNVGFIPFFPLAGGFLTGKYRLGEDAPPGSRGESSGYVQKYMTERNYTLIERLTEFARARDHSLVELAIAWLLAQPLVCSVISGVTSIDQLEMNARAFDWQLAAGELSEIGTLLGDKE